MSLARGDFSARGPIWAAAIRVFPERPLLGFGAGGFNERMRHEFLTMAPSSHNAFLGILVEQGLIGLLLFVIFLALILIRTRRSPNPERWMGTALFIVWFIGSMSSNWEYDKQTWIVLGLLMTACAHRKGVKRAASIHQDPQCFAV
ncbi:MAG: O-antigen ligase family protein [Myxococcota bacterium]